MRKLSIVLSVLVLSAAIFAAGPANLGDVKQPVMPQRPIGGRPGPALEQPLFVKASFFGFDEGFMEWIYKNLPDVEIKTQVKQVEVIGGELFATVDATNGEYKIYIAPVLLKFLKLTVKQGDKIEVKGKKLVLKDAILIIPDRMRINGKDYSIRNLLQKYWMLKQKQKPVMEKQNPVNERPAKPAKRP